MNNSEVLLLQRELLHTVRRTADLDRGVAAATKELEAAQNHTREIIAKSESIVERIKNVFNVAGLPHLIAAPGSARKGRPTTHDPEIDLVIGQYLDDTYIRGFEHRMIDTLAVSGNAGEFDGRLESNFGLMVVSSECHLYRTCEGYVHYRSGSQLCTNLESMHRDGYIGGTGWMYGSISCMKVSRDQRVLVVGTTSGELIGYKIVSKRASGFKSLRGQEPQNAGKKTREFVPKAHAAPQHSPPINYPRASPYDFNNQATFIIADRLWVTKVPEPISAIDISHTGAVVCAAFGRNITFVDTSSGGRLHGNKHSSMLTCLSFSPDGKYVACGDDNGCLLIAKTHPSMLTARTKIDRMIGVHSSSVNVVAFSPSGRFIATSGGERTVKVWDLQDISSSYVLGVHSRDVQSLSFSLDERYLASGGEISIWDLNAREKVRTLPEDYAGCGFCFSCASDQLLVMTRGYWLAINIMVDENELRSAWDDLLGAMSLIVQAKNVALRYAQDRYDARIAQGHAAYQAALAAMRASYNASLSSFADVDIAAWTATSWAHWTVPRLALPSVTRAGWFTERYRNEQLSLPCLLPIIAGQNVYISAKGVAKSRAVQAIQAIMLRLLATIPPGRLWFTLVDPVGLGENVAAFMHLADYDEQLVNGKAWTETQHIEQRLADLTRHMENVIQKYLRNQYASIEEYNEKAGEIAEPYRVLVVANFPAGFSDTAARNLVSIMQNGPRCGVYTLVLVDSALKLPYNFELDELKRGSTLIEWNGERFVWQDEDFASCTLELDTPPGHELFDRILTAVGAAAKKGTRVEVPFEKLFEMLPLQVEKFAADYPGLSPTQLPALNRPETWWSGSTELRLIAPLGRAGANKVQCLDLRDNIAPHVLVAGRTGSGKSTLLHVIILSLALTYGPEEIELYLIDFKKGVEFKTYATHHLPHARVIAIESEREFGLSVLQKLDAEMAHRGELFRGIDKGGIATYRKRSGQTLPRIFLLVDEFQEFFTEDDAISSRAAQILDRLARQGRSFGMHVLLGSQTLAGNYALARSTMDQMGVRIALQCSEADSRLILGEENPQARLLSRPGEAIYNDDNCQVEGNDFFQVAWLPDEQEGQPAEDGLRERLLKQLEARGRATQAREPYVFEGNVPADVTRIDLPALRRSIPPALVPVWLGDPIAIKDPVAACFRRQSGSNLLIVGQHEETALGMLAVTLASLAAGFGAPRTEADWQHPIQVLDFGVDGPHAGFFTTLAGHLQARAQVARRRQLPEVIDHFASEVQRRLDAEDDAQPATSRREPLFLVIHGLQRARDLRQDDGFGMSSFSSYGSEPAPPNPAQQFMSILRDGPEVGIHTIVWCDTMTNLNRTLDRRALREFALRVASQMSAEDSSNLIDSPAASKLGPNRALFYSEEEGMLEKFRPYGIPSAQWLGEVGRQLTPAE